MEMAPSSPSGKNGSEPSKVENKDREQELKVWEQHAGVIKMQRFDYAASSSLLSRSHSAFLVTCPIKREKSATKEAMSILDKCIIDWNNRYRRDKDDFPAEEVDSKRRKMISSDEEGNQFQVVDGGQVPGVSLSLVKLTKSGLLLFALPDDACIDVNEVVSNVFQFLEKETLDKPKWCHRIFPVQATCCLNSKDLKATVSKLAGRFMDKHFKNHAEHIKFAIAYNRRGLEDLPPKKIQNNGEKGIDLSLLDRTNCFNTVAAAVKDVAPDSSVDLKSPELSIFVELLPLSGILVTSLVAAVSILPRNFVSVKPRLCIKPLTSDSSAKI